MLTFKKDGARVIREHFANLSPEQFRKDLERYCPEILEEYEVRGMNPTISQRGESDNGKTGKAN